MAVVTDTELDPDVRFDGWYRDREVDERDGCLLFRGGLSEFGDALWHKFQKYKREMDLRVANYDKLEKLVDNEVISPKPDLPNVSSGETAGLVRRIARNLVQNTPNVDVISIFDDDSLEGIFSRHILTAKIIGVDEYSNDMQQNLFASTKTALTLGFDCVVPVLLQDGGGSWYIKYDTIHYRDVYPEPGAKDVRLAPDVFVRRYLSIGEVKQLVQNNAPGWDVAALRTLLKQRPMAIENQSVPDQTAKHHQTPDGYEIITWYNSFGEPFLTFSGNTKMLLRVEKNKHPLKQHPVHFLVLEKDAQQPLGKSQAELLLGRQEFQDLMLNGAMKLWYRNINPSIIGYGTVNTIPNLSPGKYTQISNPNAKLEPFEVNTGTLMQYGQISQQNLGSMVQMIGNADMQMAQQAGGGMSATPQGVDAQQTMVDVTTNNYQKAIEAFFSHYCSYALTIYFQELKALKTVQPTAEARKKLLKAGLAEDAYKDDWTLDIDFAKLAVEYWVRCVPGSLVELEDEKQMRLINQMFIPLSQAMPAIAASQDMEAMKNASRAMQYMIRRTIELSGSADADSLSQIFGGEGDQVDERDRRINEIDMKIAGREEAYELELDMNSAAITLLQEQMALMTENQGLLLEKLGVTSPVSSESSSSYTPESSAPVEQPPTVLPASA